jgi:hypothetical protein
VKRGWALAGLVAAASVAVEVAFRDAAHPVHGWHAVPGLDLPFGLLGCAVIVVVSKALGAAALQRPEAADGDDE